MPRFLKREYAFLSKPLGLWSRIALLVGAIALAISAFLPLWRIHLVAPQYMEGLELNIYSHQLKGGNGGQDLHEINNLNHYIGMKPLEEADFVEMKWVPFALGIFVLLALRTIVHGRMSQCIDLLALFTYFGLFSLGSFYYRLYTYGHNLDPQAPVTIEGFTPRLLGTSQIANFHQASWPDVGGILMMAFPIAIFLAIWFSRKEEPAL
ncbi:hypothetical protein [Pelagicoccus sp. SDUM812003]|uniref:hypothetical protein n=1 Tax=Pelagicoccus sp. SDUM812003 TaxID=3041267 RepID=UPI00280E0F9B|nr:hypothetical protein [Pelagicoccus sp. SDUM812003]MDQ8202220.1 hypothetical protein [Pelagicoccus sp. SDUM812003]